MGGIVASAPPARVQNILGGWYSLTDPLFGGAADAVSGNTGVTNISSTTFTDSSASFTPNMVGRTIHINAAATGPATLKTTVAAYVSSTQLTLTAAANLHNAAASYVIGTDNAPALQSAINALSSNGNLGGTIFAPQGAYFFAGALGGSNGENSQVQLPSITSSTNNFCSICIMGAVSPFYIGGENSLADNRGCTMFLCNIESDGTGSFINGKPASGTFTNVNVTVKDLQVKLTDMRHLVSSVNFGASATALNFANCQSACLENVQVSYTDPANAVSTTGISAWTNQPSYTSAYGIQFPQVGNGQQSVCSGMISVARGYVNGVLISEHFNAQSLAISYCVNGLVVGQMAHPAAIKNLDTEQCTNNLKVLTGTGFNFADLAIDQWTIEAASGTPSWTLGGNDIIDSGNLLRLRTNHSIYDSVNGGYQPILRMSGGQNVTQVSTRSNRFPVTLSGSPTWSTDVPTLTPPQAFSVLFNGGSTQFGTGPQPYKDGTSTDSMFIQSGGPFSLFFRFKVASSTNPNCAFDMRIPSGGNVGGNGFVVGLKVDGSSTHKMVFYANPPNAAVVGGTTVDDGAWRSCGVSCSSSGRVHIYINGSLDATGATNPGDFSSWAKAGGVACGYTFANGYDKGGTDGWTGRLCDVRWFNVELSAGDQLSLHNNQLITSYPISVLKMNEGNGTILYDSAQWVVFLPLVWPFRRLRASDLFLQMAA
jgi:hypothetical protein